MTPTNLRVIALASLLLGYLASLAIGPVDPALRSGRGCRVVAPPRLPAVFIEAP
jgi:hypothetical protein